MKSSTWMLSFAMNDLSKLTPFALLGLHARITDGLRTRGITRSSNNPTGDLAEYFFCKAFGWQQSHNSSAHVDAIDQHHNRYQIKGRRVTRFNHSRQLSAIRDFAGGHFDFLAGVLFAEDFSVLRAAIIPCVVVEEAATFVKRTNSHKFLLRDEIWAAFEVKLKAVRL